MLSLSVAHFLHLMLVFFTYTLIWLNLSPRLMVMFTSLLASIGLLVS